MTAPDFRVIFEAVPGLYLVVDPDLRVVAATDAYLTATSNTREGILGRNLFDLFPARDLRASIETVLRTRQPHKMPVQKVDERYWSPTNSPVIADGRITHIIHRVDDVTDLVRSKRQNVESEERTEQMLAADRAKDEFIAVISHELRTPMTSILGWTRMLALGGLDDATQREALESLERSTRAQAKLIEDLLDESRISSGKLRLDLRAADMKALVADAVHNARPSANAKQITVTFNATDEPCPVYGDPSRLQQVIGNVLGNAIKFTPPKGTVTATVRRENAFAVVEVTDSGRGIEPSLLPFVFERFRQGNPTGERQAGLGLGLAITRHLVEMHGGSVSATSAGAGKGSTFVIRLPLHEKDVTPPNFVGRDASARVAALPSLDGIRVVIVEDEVDNCTVLSKALQRCGAAVQCSTTADGARPIIAGWAPDVIICDIALPDRDGCSFLQEIRSDGVAVPALALTVLGRPQEQARILASGFDIFRQKPIDPVDLAHDVARLAHRESA